MKYENKIERYVGFNACASAQKETSKTENSQFNRFYSRKEETL